ncbi:hypothetical protein BKA93DRAFT_930445 [Sparassis latifolia]
MDSADPYTEKGELAAGRRGLGEDAALIIRQEVRFSFSLCLGASVRWAGYGNYRLFRRAIRSRAAATSRAGSSGGGPALLPLAISRCVRRKHWVHARTDPAVHALNDAGPFPPKNEQPQRTTPPRTGHAHTHQIGASDLDVTSASPRFLGTLRGAAARLSHPGASGTIYTTLSLAAPAKHGLSYALRALPPDRSWKRTRLRSSGHALSAATYIYIHIYPALACVRVRYALRLRHGRRPCRRRRPARCARATVWSRAARVKRWGGGGGGDLERARGGRRRRGTSAPYRTSSHPPAESQRTQPPSVSIRAAGICTPVFDAHRHRRNLAMLTTTRTTQARGDAPVEVRESPAIAGRAPLLLAAAAAALNLASHAPPRLRAVRSASIPGADAHRRGRRGSAPVVQTVREPPPAPPSVLDPRVWFCGNGGEARSALLSSPRPVPNRRATRPLRTYRPLRPAIRRSVRTVCCVAGQDARERRVSNVPPLALLRWRARIRMLLGLPHARRGALAQLQVWRTFAVHGRSLSVRLQYVSLRENTCQIYPTGGSVGT